MTLDNEQIQKELFDFFEAERKSTSKRKLLPYNQKLEIDDEKLSLKFSPKIEKEKQIKIRTVDFKKNTNSKKSLF